MMKNEIVVKELDEKNLPEIISGKFGEIRKLEESVERAIEKTTDAKKSANIAKQKSAGWFQKRVAIEALQDATVDIAEALGDVTEAQRISFEYQEKLAQITSYIFSLGAKSIAASRMVYRELEARMRDVSENELSDMAQRELLEVIRQLKEQENYLQAQKDNAEKLRSQKLKIQELEKKHEQLLSDNTMVDMKQDELIKKNKEQTTVHSKILAGVLETDKKQDVLIAETKAKSETHERILDNVCKTDKQQNEKIAKMQMENEEQNKQLCAIRETDQEQSRILEELQILSRKQGEILDRLQEESNQQGLVIDKNNDNLKKQAELLSEMEKIYGKQEQILTIVQKKIEQTENDIESIKIMQNNNVQDQALKYQEVDEKLNKVNKLFPIVIIEGLVLVALLVMMLV